jgi:hypothetical protein
VPQHWNTRHAETMRTRRTDGSLCDPSGGNCLQDPRCCGY